MKYSKPSLMLASLAAASLALTACAGDRPSPSTDEGNANSQTSTEHLVMTPAAAGELDYAEWNSPIGELSSLDPIKAFNYPESNVVANLCENLTQLQPDFSSKNNLAEEIATEDGSTYVITVREDVTFWNGDPMTTEDVVYSLGRHLDPNEGSYWSKSFDHVSSIEQTGDSEVTVTLEKPDATFPELLGTPLGSVVQESHRKEAGENYGNPEAGVMCTGQFQVNEWQQGQSILLDRYEDYWNKDHSALTKQLKINFIVDATASTNALASGELQGSYEVPTAAIPQLRETDTGQMYQGKGLQIMAIISTGNGIFADPIVKSAVTRATDRQIIGDTVYEGTGTASTSLVPATAWEAFPEIAEQRETELPDLSYDVEAAQALLEESDSDLSQPIKIAYPSERAYYADILNEMANGAAEIGITFEPVGVPSAQFGAFFSDAEARAGYDGFVTQSYLSAGDPLIFLSNIGGTGGSTNYSGFSDPAIDAALDAAKAELDPQERAKLTVTAEALIMEEQPWVPVVDMANRLYMNKDVTGVPASFVYLYYPWAADLGSTE